MMKILCSALFAACATTAFAGDVGGVTSVGQPGYYGQIDIGNVPQPQAVYPQPVLIQQGPGSPYRQHRSTCMCHRATRSTGANIAGNTTPAVVQFTLCATIGIETNTCRATGMVGDHDQGDRHDEEEHGHHDH